jgi:mono/diheme cytochrome c family protein
MTKNDAGRKPATLRPEPETAMVNRAMHGEELVAFTSGFCHEIDGRVAGRGPKPAGTKRNDVFLIDRIKNGKEGAMPAFVGAFESRKIKTILAYMHSLYDSGKRFAQTLRPSDAEETPRRSAALPSPRARLQQRRGYRLKLGRTPRCERASSSL